MSFSDSTGGTSGGPRQRELGTGGGDPVLPPRCVRRRAQVGHRRVVGQGLEGMPDALGQEDRPPLGVVESHGNVLAEGR